VKKRRGTSRTRKGTRKSRRRRYDAHLEEGVRNIRSGTSLARASRLIGVSSRTLVRYLKDTGVGRKTRGRWTIGRDTRTREVRLFSNGRDEEITIKGFDAVSRIGRFMSAVADFDENNDPSVLIPFEGESVTDKRGRRHVFETRPNVLRRLLETEEPFEEIYRIVT
jgi:helix-turn-helix, Psq domain